MYEKYEMEIKEFEEDAFVRTVSGFDSGESTWSLKPNRSDS